VIRIPAGLFIPLLFVVFFGGCVASLRPVWAWQDSRWIRAVGERDKYYFPVLVRGSDSKYSAACLGEIPPDKTLVTTDFDVAAINRDLNSSIGSDGNYSFFRIISRIDRGYHVSLEFPTTRDSKMEGWYEISDGQLLPKEILRYGPGFAFFVAPFAIGCGVAAAVVFAIFVRPKKVKVPRAEA